MSKYSKTLVSGESDKVIEWTEKEKIVRNLQKLFKINKKQTKLFRKMKKTKLEDEQILDNQMDSGKDKERSKYDIYAAVEDAGEVMEAKGDEKMEKQVQKFSKISRKQRKLLKKIEKSVLKSEQLLGGKREFKKSGKVKEIKNFIHKIGDIFLKALPKILNTVIPLMVSTYFKNGNRWRKRGAVA